MRFAPRRLYGRGLVGSGFVWCGGSEVQRKAVHAIAQPCGGWSIVKHMAQMALALRAMGFLPDHAVACITPGGNATGFSRPKRGPAAPALIFGRGVEQHRTTGGTMVFTGSFFRIKRAGAGVFRAMAKQNLLLLGGQGGSGATPGRTATQAHNALLTRAHAMGERGGCGLVWQVSAHSGTTPSTLFSHSGEPLPHPTVFINAAHTWPVAEHTCACAHTQIQA